MNWTPPECNCKAEITGPENGHALVRWISKCEIHTNTTFKDLWKQAMDANLDQINVTPEREAELRDIYYQNYGV